MDNPEKMATKHTQDDMLTPIKTWTIHRNWQHWVKHNPEKLPTLGKTYTGRYLNTNQNMDNPEKLATLGTTQSRETGNIG
jgi:hypothetical protein